MRFVVGQAFDDIQDNAKGLIFHQGDILINKHSKDPLVLLKDIQSLIAQATSDYYLGFLDNHQLHTFDIAEPSALEPAFVWVDIKLYLESLEIMMQGLICRARQILNWHRNNIFCGTCGGRTKKSETELAKVCENCNRIIYPSASPAVIVLVERGSEILLARSPHFREGVYSTLAGFIEPGESAEDTIMREVKEEVGISVKNPRYFGSQSWPFLNSFMIGFNVAYESGEIIIDNHEIEDARWFSIDNLPALPYRASISRRLIEDFRLRVKASIF